jgi:hypothetical protein
MQYFGNSGEMLLFSIYCPLPSSSPAVVKCCILPQVDSRRILDTEISSSRVLAGTKFVSSDHNNIAKAFSEAIEMSQTKKVETKMLNISVRYFL